MNDRITNLPNADMDVLAFLSIPGNATNVHSRFYRDALRLGLSEDDAEDGAQTAMERLIRHAGKFAALGRNAVSAFYGTRAFMRRMLYRSWTDRRRAKHRRLAAPVGDMAAVMNVRPSMADNPRAIAMAVETAQRMRGQAMGRNAAAIRRMTDDDIRGLACPSLQGLSDREPGEAPRIVPAVDRPRPVYVPPTPGDGTEWRTLDATYVEYLPPIGTTRRAKEWRRLEG